MTVMWSKRRYTKEHFIAAWESSVTLAQLSRALGCNRSGGGYHSLRSAAEDLGLDWSGKMKYAQGHSRKIYTSRSLDQILVEHSDYTKTNDLKIKLWKSGLLPQSCQICGIVEWLGKPAPLALDHINGVRSDNRIDNLRVLCYNCHGQTETFGSKNMRR